MEFCRRENLRIYILKLPNVLILPSNTIILAPKNDATGTQL